MSRIAAAFGAAAATYDASASVQRLVAARLAERIAALPLPPRPRVLEIGCGTGFLTAALRARLPEADWTISDVSAGMVAACRGQAPDAAFLVADGERPPFAAASFDLVCSSLAFQWFADIGAALPRLAALVRPGGRLAFSTLLEGTFAEWRAAHAALGLEPDPGRQSRRAALLGVPGLCLDEETVVQACGDARGFLAALRAIGAHTPSPGRRPLMPGQLKAVMARFEADGAACTYRVGYGMLARAQARGVFVTGTDTGVGKTLVSAVLVRAWGADYWKPLQTGLADEAGDSPTVAALAGVGPHRIHPGAYALQAPLSPHAAAALEDVVIDAGSIVLPHTDAPLVVEGAGGVLVPVSEEAMVIDLMTRLGLPAVVVARSGLGTINHTLLTLQALRQRGVPILGVILNGPPNAGNRAAIEARGAVRVLAEFPALDAVTPEAVHALARAVPPLDDLLGG